MSDAYGLGIMHIGVDGRDWIGHAGSQMDAAGFAFHEPQDGITIVALTNAGTLFSERTQTLFYTDLWQALRRAATSPGGPGAPP